MNGKLYFWIQNFRYSSEGLFALCIGIFGGIVGVLVDLDHPISFFFQIANGRFLHYPLFFIVLFVFFCLCSYMGRLLFIMVLNNIRSSKKCFIED